MHPETLVQYQKGSALARETLACCKWFLISEEIRNAATALASREIKVTKDGYVKFPVSANLPGARTGLVLPGEADGVMVLEALPGRHVVVSVVKDGDIIPCAKFRRGDEAFEVSMGSLGRHRRPMLSEDQILTLNLALLRLAMIISLINEPRRVTVLPASGRDWTRQHRRLVERLTGRAAMAYSVVSWQVGAGVKAKGNLGDGSGLRVALHWCRAHWRRAEAHHPRSEWVKPHLGGEAGWHTWVKDCWKGHPDHGIKLQQHEPRMIGEKRQGGVTPAVVPNALKLAAMTAQQRHSMVEAGFVPSATIN